jgi:hypothetical protein
MRANQIAALASTDRLIAAKEKQGRPVKKDFSELLAQQDAKHYRKLSKVQVRK